MTESSQVLDSTKQKEGASLARFLLPSLLGVLMFLVPFTVDGKVTIGMGVLADWLKSLADAYLVTFIAYLTLVAGVVSLMMRLWRPTLAEDGKATALLRLFDVSWTWTLIRFAGGIFAVMTYHKFGLEPVYNGYTGGTILHELAPTIFIYLAVAVVLLPVLTDYGLMEFVGTFLQRIFQKVFRLPGRSAIDVLASWMGAGTVGVLITAQQYDKGFYSQREAAVIATNFSIVSVAFCLVIARFVNIDHLFVPYYLSVCVVGIITAIIVPRLPPLSRLPQTYFAGRQLAESAEHETLTGIPLALQRACQRAAQADPIGKQAKHSALNIVDIWMGLFPAVMAIGTVALILNEYTPIFQYLSYPFVPLLELLRLPEAQAAAPAMIVGFADMFLPAVIGKGIESELTRFVIAGMSVSQLIYMSEIGVLILKSNIPLNVRQLLAIFLLRTLISLPLLALAGHIIVG
ncbi:YjiH family protein [Balneatrix alpica]|uniref:YjiH family protein n=1 Tax=Balneatrix alpica TaxID=75684 RepID=UPI00273A5948|nr:YjiH family protein [Balneatrix alpica]